MEQDVEMEVRIPWRIICKMAVNAFISGRTFNELATSYINDYVTRHQETTIEDLCDMAESVGCVADIRFEKRR